MKTSTLQGAGTAILSILAPAAMAATHTVITTGDVPGSGSFRDAIIAANLDPVPPVVIDFNVPTVLLTPPGPGGVAVIQPSTPLPVIQNVNGLGIMIDGYLGIDLRYEPGVTPNDPGDPDRGPNRLVNFPLITSVGYGAGGTVVSGTLDIDSNPTAATVELFTAIPDATGSNQGQGAVYLGSATPVVGGTWTTTVPIAAPPGTWVTATATDVNGNTSEFARNVPVENGEDLDWGDAPDRPYPTLSGSGGANHVIVPGMYLGASIDGEADGQPDATATGDDNAGWDDEDGVAFPITLVQGQLGQIDITASVVGRIDAWIDFDGNGAWNLAAEQILSSAIHPGGVTQSYVFPVPAGAVPGPTFARIRYSGGGNLLPTGGAQDGEVEDLQVTIDQGQEQDFDWGDAPDPGYPTLLVSNGARHAIVPGVFLGAQVDPEPDGQPDSTATGDDVLDGNDDEDGVVFTTPLNLGQAATMQVTASVPGFVDAWCDFDGDGSFGSTATELIYSGPVNPGVNNLNFNVPGTAVTGPTFARIRFNTATSGLPPTGPAIDGEVEDHQVNIDDQPAEDFDWGDAPDPSYPTLLASNGARHMIVPGIFLGAQVDPETDGQPDPTATGDDVLDGNDDEDGVLSTSPLIWGQVITFQVTASAPGFVDAWIDLNGNGTWEHPIERIASQPVTPGPNSVAFVLPPPPGPPNLNTFARFRYNTQSPGLRPSGGAPDGEVEDYLVTIREQEIDRLDWGDAPDRPYPTLAGSFGANHFIVPGMMMGNLIDGEPNGQPNATATGDDLANLDDEDGVWFSSPPMVGQPVTVNISVTLPGAIDAWIDYNQDGTWVFAELILPAATPVVPGLNSFVVNIPGSALPGSTFARFRYSTNGGLIPTGPAPDGEVEDYELHIEEGPQQNLDWGDAPDPSYPTLAASNGARHVITNDPTGIIYQLGLMIDPEPNGQPDPTATGDDVLDGIDDEDGVVWYPLVSGSASAIDVTASLPGVVDVWIDFDGNGSWLDAGEKVLSTTPVNGGGLVTQLGFAVPAGATAGTTFARVRYSSNGVTSPTGLAPDGEVEDYELRILSEGEGAFDFGDAPDPTYPTLSASAGAAHLIGSGLFLGLVPGDAEPDGQPDPNAMGDDLFDGNDDEDGVTFGYALISGQPTVVEIVASAPGLVDMWIDWNRNGSWGDLGDSVLIGQAVNPGPNYVTIPVQSVGTGPTFARVRISSAGGLPPTGFAPDGEVEDYRVELYDDSEGMDFGDAPDLTVGAATNFPTTMMDFGAAHLIDNLFLGLLIDAEPDGQPTAGASGDDTIGAPDEDGVMFNQVWVSGSTAQITVMVNPAAPGPADLDLWVDWDGDGTWTQSGEHVIASFPVNSGPNSFTILIPAGLGPVDSYVRFRLTHAGTGIGYGGFVHGGEVEDYLVPIGKPLTNWTSSIDRSVNPNQFVMSWVDDPAATNYSIYSSTNLLPTFPHPPNWVLETSGIGSSVMTWSQNLNPAVPTKFFVLIAFP